MKKASLLSVVLFGLCAVIWTIKTGYEVVSMPYPTTPFLLILDVVCAMLFIVAFIVQLKRYTRSKKEE